MTTLALTAGLVTAVSPTAHAVDAAWGVTPAGQAVADPAAPPPTTATPAPSPSGASTAGEVAAVRVPGGTLPRFGMTPLGQAPPVKSLYSVPASVRAGVYGPATVSGQLVERRSGVSIVAEVRSGEAWQVVGTTKTDANGAFTLSVNAGEGRLGPSTVQLTSGDAVIAASATRR